MITYRKQLFAEGNSEKSREERLDEIERQIKELRNPTEKNDDSEFRAAFKQILKECVKEIMTEEKDSAKMLTKEEILKIKNPAERQKAIKENIKLFK